MSRTELGQRHTIGRCVDLLAVRTPSKNPKPQAHDAPVSKLSWAHPEFGAIIASSSFDRTVKIWEETFADPEQQQVNGAPSAGSPSSSRWVERSVISDAKGSVRAVEFAPRYFGLKLVRVALVLPCVWVNRNVGNDILRQPPPHL